MTKHPSLALALAAGAVLQVAPLLAQGTPDPDLDRAHHVLRRMTFGPDRALVSQLSTGLPAVQAYIAAQLNPPAVGAPNYHGSASLDELLTGSIAPGTTGTLLLPSTLGGAIDQLQTSIAQVAYALESEWQLREVMTQFWDRHFNTNLIAQSAWFIPYIPAGANDDYWAWWFEWEANQHYRANCLTTFYDLLYFTSRHASMMIYLHMPQNNGSRPNEDYARELVELYTMSPEHLQPNGTVLQNYVQDDIEEIARILTGWDLDEPNAFVFQFDDPDHAYPTVAPALFASSALPVTLTLRAPPNGEQEGIDLLAELARHPATATFICRKLIAYFIDEGLAAQPNPQVLQNMLAVWGQQGDIKAVLGALFASSEFEGSTYHLTRIRIPLESVVATARAVEARMKKNPAIGNLADPASMTSMVTTTFALGQSLLNYPAPNGFPTDNNAQLSPSVGLERAYWGWNVLFYTVPAHSPATDPVAFIQPVQPPLPASPTASNVIPHLLAVIDYLLTSFYGSNYTLEDEQRVADAMVNSMDWVTAQTSGPYAGQWDPAKPAHYTVTIWVAFTAALGFVQSGQR